MKPQVSLIFPLSLAGVCVCLLAPGCSDAEKPLNGRDLVTQVSSYDALALGLYGGIETLENLRPHGDFGLGTLHGWNGEILLMEGKYHLIDGDGQVKTVTDLSATTPFLEMTWFDEDEKRTLPEMTTHDSSVNTESIS